MAKEPTVAIAGAGGFVGRALCESLAKRGAAVVALSRTKKVSSKSLDQNIQFRKADLFSLLQVEQALLGADVGVYLVHSMMPAARLTQGKFEDLDLVLADNFARAAKKQNIKRIVYLGGLIPKEDSLSRHLISRHEVEQVLASTGIPVVTLRAGLIVGRGGSSLQILVNLVKRLPAMLCPRWTRSLCQPIALVDVVNLLTHSILDEDLPAKAYDVGGPDVLSYRQMLEKTAAVLGVKRRMQSVPWFSPGFSALWVAGVTGAKMPLVQPLVDSLRHDMIATDLILNERYQIVGQTFEESLREAIKSTPNSEPTVKNGTSMSVCSIQRLSVQSGMTVSTVAKSYASWVSEFLRPLIDAQNTEDGSLHFYYRPLGIKRWTLELLTLEYSASRSTDSRSLFYITGGLLAARDPKRQHAGRFEFRRVPGRDEVVVAVLDFRPRLPWWIYKISQAVAHSFIMYCFGRRMLKVRNG
jgi:uncharacterized protein YbjT (DUF2867 family)